MSFMGEYVIIRVEIYKQEKSWNIKDRLLMR